MNENELKQLCNQKYCNTETFLMDLGISKEYIHDLKQTKIKEYRYPSIVFDYLGRSENIIIPTEKIIGSNLFGNIGYYWYSLVKYAFDDNNKYYGLNMKTSRLRQCLAYLYEQGWDTWNKSYQTGKIGELYFSSLETPNKDLVYMHEGGKGGGRHRFFAAKIGNADCIRAKYVDKYRVNTEKLEYYRTIIKKETEIMCFIQNSSMFEKRQCKHKDEKDCCDTEIIHHDLYYTIHIGELFRAESMLKNTEHFKVYLLELQNIMAALRKIENIALSQNNWTCHIYPKWYLKKKLFEKQPAFTEVFEELLIQKSEVYMEYLKWHQKYNNKLKYEKYMTS